ncbi:MAG: hypothetical protein IKW48_06185 [Akkermansia sp.]|nr:hypothetical protein [Akkermansia sp.]
MNTPETNEREILRGLLGNDAFVTPAAMAAGLEWIKSAIVAELAQHREKEGAALIPEYGTQHQLATYFNVSDATVERIIRPLLAAGKVRVLRVPTLTGKKGHPRYRIADVEQAMIEGDS